jgi:uncharacterized membrane protein YfcA
LRATPGGGLGHDRNADAGTDHLADCIEIPQAGAHAQPHAEPRGMFGDVDLERGRIRQGDEVVISYFQKIDTAAIDEFAAPRRHQHQPVFAELKPLEIFRQRMLGGKAKICRAAGNRRGDVGTFAFLDIEVGVGMLAQESRQRLRQMHRQSGGVGEQMHADPDAGRVGRKVATHHLDIVHDEARMIAQAFAGRGQLDTPAAALEQRDTEVGFQALDPGTCGRERQMRPYCAMRDTAAIGDRDEKLKIDQIKSHGQALDPSAFVIAEGSINKLQIVPVARIGQCRTMTISILVFIAAVFLLAGFVKGVIGLGLPTVSMGLLAVAMAPAHALAIVIVPAILTNIWQTFVGSYLRDIVVRLWPLLLGLAVGIWLNADMMTGPYARYGTVLIGVLLVIYAIISLRKFAITVRPRDEKWVGGVIGVTTGVISAATGVQVIPSMPFLQALGLKKDELIQALGVFFTVATLAQAFNLSAAGLLNESTALPGVIALAFSFTGMAVGQAVRTRLEPEAFRHWFLISMILLGIYLAAAATYEIYLA